MGYLEATLMGVVMRDLYYFEAPEIVRELKTRFNVDISITEVEKVMGRLIYINVIKKLNEKGNRFKIVGEWEENEELRKIDK